MLGSSSSSSPCPSLATRTGSNRADRVSATRSGFADVYDEHVWAVYGFIAYRVYDRATAEDLTQMTFERALRAWARFDPRRASERTWLLAIARNLVVDHHRRGARAQLEPLEERHEPHTTDADPLHHGSPELVAALAHLSERDREIIALRFGGDMSGSEIAAFVGLSLASVQQVLSRSLRRLRKLLDDAEASGVAEREAVPARERRDR